MNACDISDSLRIQSGFAACENCGSTARVGRGFCLNCMLQRALGCETETTETLDEVLDDTDVRDADWRIGNYQILEEIGRGGMGVIYRARQRHSRRIVALKRILSYQAESQRTLARFRREAEAAASLDHPNILPIYEVSESDDGLPFFSMKFATGGSLSDAARSLRADPRRIVALMAKVARAVQCAHIQGILHRDLKPGNILLDGRGEPMVSDFGLAKWLDTSSDLTRTLMIFGTPGYIAPEQAHGAAKNLTQAADIYSIGAVLFDLFTGRTPFLGEHALAVIKQASEKPAPKLRTLAPLADRDLETICAKCLEREPQARYHSAGDLAEDLERWLEGRPIIARPVSPPVRIWRWSKRNPKLAGSIAACTLAAAAAAVWQIQSSHLAATVREEQLAAHSVTIFPMLDLDDVSTTSARAIDVTKHLFETLRNVSSMRVHVFPPPQAEAQDFSWKESDLRRAVLNSGSRAFLLGTIRQHGNTVKAVLNVVDATNGRLLAQQLLSAPKFSLPTLFSSATAQAIWSDWAKNGDGRDHRYLHADLQSATKNQLARDYVTAGDDFFGRRSVEDVDRAIECYRKAIAADPECALALASLASATAMRVQLSTTDPVALIKAEKMAKRAADLDPLLSEAHRAEAVCYYISGRYPEAIEEATVAFELNPTYQRAVGLLGFTANEMGRPDVALRWFRWGQRLQSQPGEYESSVAMALILLGEYSEAEAVLRQGAQFRPDFPYHEISLAILRLQESRFEEAQKVARDVATRFASNIEAAQIHAEADLFAGHLQQAEQLYRKLLEQDRRGGLFVSGLSYLSATGWICLQTGRESEGRELLSEAAKNDKEFLETAPSHSQHLYSLAGTMAALGDYAEAVALLDRAIQAGWINYRYTRIDPRFRYFRDNKHFNQILSDLEKKVEELRRQQPAEILTANTERKNDNGK
jgi:serine/threonine protein kinase/Tfp pilus assembly protein PilF